ncbi:MAG: hypothetical protein P1U89_03020 [Verrucomicrobiales bacterium]|nr:hypothetical protein [Verrucomicrobiales bacterium]
MIFSKQFHNHIRQPKLWLTLILTTLVIAGLLTEKVNGFAFVTAGGDQNEDTVVHPAGYKGRGGTLEITLALHSDFAELEDDIEFSATQAASIWNHLTAPATTISPSVEIPASDGTDVFGVLLHEMGHNLGLAHPALGPQRGMIPKPVGKYTASAKGENGKFDLNHGADGVGGTSDDERGDDINLNYFKKSDNNPFTFPPSGVYDSTTYSRKLEDLPAGSKFSTVADRTVAVSSAFQLSGVEALMVTGGSLRLGQVRRGLAVDDIAGIRYAMSGLDEIQGTSDDYTLDIKYIGVDDDADILIRFDGNSPFAGAGVATKLIEGNHFVMTPGRMIRYNPNLPGNRKWFFPISEPHLSRSAAINARALQLSFKTEVGKRYAVTWPDDALEEEETADQIIVQYGAENLKPISGSLFIFIAESEDTLIKIAFPSRRPELDEVACFHITGKELEL